MAMFVALALWCTLLLAPETPIGRAIARWTVTKPAARLNRITRGQVMLVVLMASGVGLLTWLIGHEAVRLMAMGTPELAVWATTFEVTAYLDAFAAIVAAASAARFGMIRAWVRSVVTRRPAREHRARRTRAAANDDEDSRGVPLAA